ncbi:hypothetical protein [Shewanella vaxholmensis]|uniref:Uncharacterized protein n=1 Tax=Shewanella vaxholmensis TaxID=3063535 RepID=A0ABU9UWN3_9GAMM
MNDPMLLVERLGDLIHLAKDAETGFEKAAVYAAASCVATEFNTAYTEKQQFDSYVLEKVMESVWSINAIVGYDVTNAHPKEQHVSWAIGSLNALRGLIEK